MHPIQTILVPSGAEYQAVARGLQGADSPKLIAIPMGIAAVSQALANRPDLAQSRILVMGLCGSLQPAYQIGDAVLYQNAISPTGKTQRCNAELTTGLQSRLPQIPLVQSVTSAQFVQSAAAKQQLGQLHQAGAVDMEGSAILTVLPQAQIAMLRVISDDCEHELPDLSQAIGTGKLRTLPLITTLLRQPLGSLRLIRGSLRGLKALEQITQQLFQA
jgi:uridine phosphorylase